MDEHMSWMLYYHDGRMNVINGSSLVIDSFRVMDEGVAICQIKDNDGKVVDEKHFFLTSDPTELIDYHFESYDQVFVDTDINNTLRHCGPDQHIAYTKEDVADFHIDFVQHYEHIRQHSNHIHLRNVKHEDEGYYECVVRLHNGLVGVRVFFLTVGGGPRQITNRETHMHSETNDSITLLCPIFSAVPAWFTFILPKDSTQGVSSLTGHDYVRIKHVSDLHAGMYTCRVTTSDDGQGYSLTADIYVDVYGPPDYVAPHRNEYVLISMERNTDNLLRCSINGNPTPTYQWFLGDISVKEEKDEVVSDGINYIMTAKKSDAPGSNQTVTCIAKNNRGSKRQVFIVELVN